MWKSILRKCQRWNRSCVSGKSIGLLKWTHMDWRWCGTRQEKRVCTPGIITFTIKLVPRRQLTGFRDTCVLSHIGAGMEMPGSVRTSSTPAPFSSQVWRGKYTTTLQCLVHSLCCRNNVLLIILRLWKLCMIPGSGMMAIKAH